MARPLQTQVYDSVVVELAQYVNSTTELKGRFDLAIKQARDSGIVEMRKINDMDDFYDYCNEWLKWVPSESVQGKDIYFRICLFYFIFNQKAVRDLQSPIAPGSSSQELTTLSKWLVKYAKALGAFLDTPESITDDALESFRASPNYNMKEYIVPPRGFKTFNDLFARNFKPGLRPVAAILDPSVIVSPADCTYGGQGEIRSDSGVTIKGIHWQISELLQGSAYANRFNGGIFTHSFLGPNDYHRQHAPVGGRVLEAINIQGQVYLEVNPVQNEDGELTLIPQRRLHNPVEHKNVVSTFGVEFDGPDNPGYQFVQTRGLFILDTAIGLVAVLPMGMAQVSSVVLTAEVGVTLRKGEELSFFQFGGSDIVVLYENRSNVSMTAVVGTHYKVGTRIAQAFPV